MHEKYILTETSWKISSLGLAIYPAKNLQGFTLLPLNDVTILIVRTCAAGQRFKLVWRMFEEWMQSECKALWNWQWLVSAVCQWLACSRGLWSLSRSGKRSHLRSQAVSSCCIPKETQGVRSKATGQHGINLGWGPREHQHLPTNVLLLEEHHAAPRDLRATSHSRELHIASSCLLSDAILSLDCETK